MSTVTKIEIPGLGTVVVEARPDAPNAAPDAFKPILGWACSARTVPADADDIVAGVRALFAADYTEDGDMESSTYALESLFHIVSAVLSILEAARSVNASAAVRREAPPFDETDLREVGQLAYRLATHGPHLLAEIDGLESRQAALWSAATGEPADEAAE
ncbi:MAG: hypothetical protein JNL79_29310 [Myxococcales bacterium]|nr:hypothetical protein [Myxococcales bacterium]